MEEKKEVVKKDDRPLIESAGSMLMDTAKFEHAFRVANMLSSSTMVPQNFQGKNNVGNCMIALNLADRLKADPMMIMQKLYIIHGKPAMESQLQIALFQASNKYAELSYNLSGDGDARNCYCTAINNTTGETVKGPMVSIKMAKDEGWYQKNGSKWKTLPDLMLHYRAASFFISVNDPASRMGMITQEEASDIKVKSVDVTVKSSLTEREDAAFENAKREMSLCNTQTDIDEVFKNYTPEIVGKNWHLLDQFYLTCVEACEKETIITDDIIDNCDFEEATK